MNILSARRPGEIEGNIQTAALETLAHQITDADFKGFHAGRHTGANIKTTVVDAANLPTPGETVVFTFFACESGHAGDGHGVSRHLEYVGPLWPGHYILRAADGTSRA